MKKAACYLLISFIMAGFVLTSIPSFAADKAAQKSPMSATTNPIKDIIDETPTIKEMQSKPARAISYTVDVLDNRVPTQTEKSGKLNL